MASFADRPGREATHPVPDGDLVCGGCGRRIVLRRDGTGYVHAGRGPVAACDLDADHPAVPRGAPIADASPGRRSTG